MMNTTENAFSEARPQFFANRFLRLLIKTAAAQEFGADCLALLTVIAMTEDARRYRGPVTFWNNQLLPLVGFSKWERLDKARKAAIDSGWLAYEPGGRHKPGRYRVTIPAELQEVEDAAVDEGQYPLEGYQAGDQELLGLPQTDSDTEAEGDTKPESKRVATGGTSRAPTGGTSLPIPEPDPAPVPKPQEAAASAAGVKRFVPPSVDQVRDYCQQRGNTVDPETFVDFYASKGWKIGSGPMKDWQAAVRNWERRNGNRTQNTPTSDDPRGNFAAGQRYLENCGGGNDD